MRFYLRAIILPVVAAAALFALIDDSWAAGVIFKDGFAVKGRVRREGHTETDAATGQAVTVAKGFFMIDDPVRRIVFSLRHVQDIVENEDANPDLVVLTRPFGRRANTELKFIQEVLDVKDWDENWDRNVKLMPSDVKRAEVAEQRIRMLTPQFAWVAARNFGWDAMYPTRELGPDLVRKLLYSHESLKDKGGRADLKKRLTIARFLRQAGWHEHADQELTQLLKDLPGEEKAIADARQAVQKDRAIQTLTDLDAAYKAGRHGWAQKTLDDVPRDLLDAEQLKRLRDLRAKYETAGTFLKDSQRFLKSVPELISDAATRKQWEAIAEGIRADLTIDNAERLEKFVQFAQQDERERKASKPPTTATTDLMALAISGWMLGKDAAEAKADFGLKLWQTRQFVTEYQKTHNGNGRQKLLAAYEKTGALPFDELAQLMTALPPPEPEEKLSPGQVTEQEATNPNRRKGVSFLLQLPPEYRHGRAYPLLVALHNAGEKPKDMIERWGDLAAYHGYVLVAPEWGGGAFSKSYTYSQEEHAVVLDTIRDMQRRYNVDCDRIFLTGYGEGGVMAFDVGLSHPDIFAGVLPFAAVPRYFPVKYAVNGHHVPFYVVSGTLQPPLDSYKILTRQFDVWVRGGHPSLWISYRGRGLEWFGGEMPLCMDWMNLRKRNSIPKETVEFQSHRPTDNRFYWLTVDGIGAGAVIEPGQDKFYYRQASIVQGKVSENNRINVQVRGFKQMTVWIARGMVDFEKPVAVWVNGTSVPTTRKLTPSLGILLEDFYQRNDRSRLFVAKVEFSF